MILWMLDADRKPINAPDLTTWGKWFENDDNRRVARDEIRPGVMVSTVFLGVDHNRSGRGGPILFETMVFTDGDGGKTERYRTWAEAEAGHRKLVAALRITD